MSLSLEALAVLDAIERRGSFAGAAAELGRVPSAITYTVRRLEDDVDALLFDRRAKRARFTSAGRELLAQGRTLLAEAAALKARVHRIGSGWEADLGVAVDTIVPMTRLLPLCARFDVDCRERQASHTRLRLGREVLGGAWDALAQGRVDLVVGASGEPPPGGGWRTRLLAQVPLVFAVAPSHALAGAREPLSEADIAAHRIVVATDSSQKLPSRSVGVLHGQDALGVPDLATKLAAQAAGLGCGWLPFYLAAEHVRDGRLVVRRTEVPRSPTPVYVAWREPRPGRALAWWIEAVGSADWRFLAAGPAAGPDDDRPARKRPRAGARPAARGR
jgi:DNA-binding transcriptional LysR family regulator